MEFRKDIAEVVCEQTRCRSYKIGLDGSRYCGAYFPECDEYEDYEEFLEIRSSYSKLKDKIANLKFRLRDKGIVIPIQKSKIEKITKED